MWTLNLYNVILNEAKDLKFDVGDSSVEDVAFSE
jgi:hypothetical protein